VSGVIYDPFNFSMAELKMQQMKGCTHFSGLMIACLAFLAALSNAGVCLAQDREDSSIGTTDDCTKISVNFKDAPNLTHQEKTALMDKALQDSLNRYERCQNAHSSAASAGGAGGGGGANGGNSGNKQRGSSTASASMSGTNTADKKKPSASGRTGVSDAPVNKGAHERTKSVHALNNGKIPDDIPPADNDSVLEEQIRQAAINETDPVIREKLWNEYRKYKGLPVVSKP